MSKETDIAISVTVKDGPKTQPQATKLPKDYCASNVRKAANEEVELSKSKKTDTVMFPDRRDACGADLGEALTFVTIHADRYTYKDACGKEQPGIWYSASDCADTTGGFLDGPHVYIHRRLQPLDLTKLSFEVCDAMLDCITDPEKRKVVINVTYGIGDVQCCTKCKPCKPALGDAGYAVPSADVVAAR